MSDATPIYRRLAAELEALIIGGTLRFGDRLPSIRDLMAAKRVSAPTVLEALRVLEDSQLIEARPRSGHYVAHRDGARRSSEVYKPSNVDVLQLCAPILDSSSRPGLLPFGAAVPSPELFPNLRLRQIMSKVLRTKGETLGTYAFAPGMPRLRFEITKRAASWSCSLDPDRITITNGCVEAVGLALRATTKPGEIVAIESPCYYGFVQMLEMLHLKVIEIPTDRTCGLSVPDLAAAADRHDIKACLLSTTVSNPTGATMPPAAKIALVSLLEQRGIPLIEDATFADLQFSGDNCAAKSFDRTGNVLLCASLTKTIAPGLRIGWIEAGNFAERIGHLKRVSSIGQPEVAQEVLAQYLAAGGVDRHLRRLRRVLAQQLDEHMAAIARLMPSTRVIRPTGGFLLWVELPSHVDSLALQSKALDFGIGLAPGPLFSAAGSYRNYMRVNCGLPWTVEVQRGYEQMAQLLN